MKKNFVEHKWAIEEQVGVFNEKSCFLGTSVCCKNQLLQGLFHLYVKIIFNWFCI